MKKECFDSEFAHVKYLEKERAVLLTWKKFCCLENYRTPTSFALGLLQEHRGIPFLIDARNGFEDAKEDVEWGFSYLLPALAETGCPTVVFIKQEVSGIEEELDLWTQEFLKYFEVKKVCGLPQALDLIRG